MDLGRLSTPDRITIGAAVVLLVATFMGWFNVNFLGSSVDASGWELGWFWGRLPLFLGLLMAAHVLVSAFAEQITLPDLPWTHMHLVAGGSAAALILLRTLLGHEASGVDFHRSLGLLLALLAALGLAAAGLLRHRQSLRHE